MKTTNGADLPLQQLIFAAICFWFAQIVDILNEGERENAETTVRVLWNCPRNDKPRYTGNYA